MFEAPDFPCLSLNEPRKSALQAVKAIFRFQSVLCYQQFLEQALPASEKMPGRFPEYTVS